MSKLIMFQGDSITDAGRDRSDNHLMVGYPAIIKEKLQDAFEYVNYAVSGDTTTQCLERHLLEVVEVKPDILVLFIGVNDIWRIVDEVPGNYDNPLICSSNITKMIEATKASNGDVKIIYVEPYLLPGFSNVYERGYEIYQRYIKELRSKIPALVDSYIVLQDEFERNFSNGVIYAEDGVHPNGIGQKYIAGKVVEVFKNLDA